jgi:diacylglycerol kinase (ATP)
MFQFFVKLYKAYLNSWNGLKNAWRFQWAFRVEVILLFIAIPCTFFLGKNAAEYVLLLGSLCMLLVVEIINSAIETTINRVGLEFHELSGLAKDLASAAVFLAIVNALITWGIIVFF